MDINGLLIFGMEFEEILIDVVANRPLLYNSRLADYKNTIKREAAWREIASICKRTANECQTRWRSLRDRYVREKRKLQTSGDDGSTPKDTWQYLNRLKFLDNHLTNRRTIGNIKFEPETSNIKFEPTTSMFDYIDESSYCVPVQVAEDTLSPEVSQSGDVPSPDNTHSDAVPDDRIENYRISAPRKKRKIREEANNADLLATALQRSADAMMAFAAAPSQDEDTLFLLSLAPYFKKLSVCKKLELKTSILQLLMKVQEEIL